MIRELATTKPGPKHKPVKCSWCNGTGEEPIDYSDRRKGTKTCHRCDGRGES